MAAPAIVVSCLVDARLAASPYDFNLNDQGWIQRSFLTADTAKWSWFVGPKIGGSQTLLLQLRPIVEMRPAQGGSASFVSAEETSNVRQYEITASVSVPFTERVPEVMSRLAASFKVAQGLVESITGLLTALAALLAFLGIKRWRKKRPSGRGHQHQSPGSRVRDFPVKARRRPKATVRSDSCCDRRGEGNISADGGHQRAQGRRQCDDAPDADSARLPRGECRRFLWSPRGGHNERWERPGGGPERPVSALRRVRLTHATGLPDACKPRMEDARC